MRDQYAGDISDVIKFAFLRAIAREDRTLGIAWYFAPGHDGRPDGRHLEWRDDLAWRTLDHDLHAGLVGLAERSVSALETAKIWPKGTLFHRDPVPPRTARLAWGIRKRKELDGADIMFLDPDNGIGGETTKHATLSEIRLLRRPGRAIVFITFPGRTVKHDDLLNHLHVRVASETEARSIVTLRTSVSVPSAPNAKLYVPRQRWFTVVDPDEEVVKRVHDFAGRLTTLPRVRTRTDTFSSMTE